jgi:uncharacterized membrane protein (Fun14 family)
MLGAADLTGWWVGYAVGAVIVVVVAVLLILIILTARGIATAAEDATRSLAEARDRTEVLWQLAATKQVAADLLDGAEQARGALGE